MKRLLPLAWLLLTLAAAPARAAMPDWEVVFRVPLRVHLLRADTGSPAATRLAPADMTRVMTGVNTIWRAAGVAFELECVVEERAAGPLAASTSLPDPAQLQTLVPTASFEPRAFNAYFIGQMQGNGILVAHQGLPAVFVKESARLRPVPGPTVETLSRVLAHELGHALGLAHREEVRNLMASGTTGTSLNAREQQTVRLNLSTVSWIRRSPAQGR